MAGPDVLSQAEIDDLLSDLSTGVVSAEAMKLEIELDKLVGEAV